MNCEHLPFLKQPLEYNQIDTIGVVLVPSLLTLNIVLVFLLLTYINFHHIERFLISCDCTYHQQIYGWKVKMLPLKPRGKLEIVKKFIFCFFGETQQRKRPSPYLYKVTFSRFWCYLFILKTFGKPYFD